MDIQEFFIFLIKVTKLRVTHGLILTTPAKEIKRMKLRQIEKEVKTLVLDIQRKGYNGIK